MRAYHPSPAKLARAQKAKDWFDEMARSRAGAIDACVEATKTFDVGDYASPAWHGREPNILLADADSVSALFQTACPDGTACILNFASYTWPGGGFLKGAMAQEEALCAESPLANVLAMFNDTFYAENRRNTNGGAYLDRMLLTPGIPFMRDGIERSAWVLTCAAPNLKRSQQAPDANHETLDRRVNKIFMAVESSGCSTFIAGAWGCGVFGQDPYEVARIMIERTRTSNLDCVVFAVPSASRRNYLAFRDAIADTSANA